MIACQWRLALAGCALVHGPAEVTVATPLKRLPHFVLTKED